MPSGGKREGAGRKPVEQPKQNKNYRLATDVLDFLATQENQAKTLEDTIRRSKGYREWKNRTRNGDQSA